MNGKQAKRMRRIAMKKAHSFNQAADRKHHSHRGVSLQRVLDPFSLKSIVKKMKTCFKATPRPSRSFDIIFQYYEIVNNLPKA
jgi:hypothetical protein